MRVKARLFFNSVSENGFCDFGIVHSTSRGLSFHRATAGALGFTSEVKGEGQTWALWEIAEESLAFTCYYSLFSYFYLKCGSPTGVCNLGLYYTLLSNCICATTSCAGIF